MFLDVRDFYQICEMLKVSRWLFVSFCSRESSSFFFFQFAKLSSREVEHLDHVFHEILQFPSQRVGLKNTIITRWYEVFMRNGQIGHLRKIFM